EEAAFVTVGAIALQGVRQAEVVLGHEVAVIGLGLLGQLTVQILKAAGCRVFGIDLNPARVDLALELGADAACINEHALSECMEFTRGRGCDAILITADTSSDEPVALAGDLARDRAPVVAVGAVGLSIPRKVYYEKELDLRLSRSYGPGRYDADYEEKGQDYPYAYVRWTEGRNMEAFVRLLADGAVRVKPLITHRFAIDQATSAYDLITGKVAEPFLGVVLTYDFERILPRRIDLESPKVGIGAPVGAAQSAVRVGLLGAGTFANAVLLPAMRGVPGLEFVGAVSGSGLNARASGDRFGFAYCASDADALITDPQINWLVIVTRHDLHAVQVIRGLEAGKDVFVEKPLALDRDELLEVVRTQSRTDGRLMVGFNRRFAPMVRNMARFLADHRRPLIATCRVNAGDVPGDHWTQDMAIGGGRIIGEACHFVDLLQFLIGAPPLTVTAHALEAIGGAATDEAILTLTFADGSVGTVVYSGAGDRAFGKERIEVLGDGRVAILDDYRQLELVRDGKRTRQTERLRPDKGHRGEWEAIVAAARTGGPAPIPLREIVASHLATYAAVTSIREGRAVSVDAPEFWDLVAAETEPVG
ncbi:MAG TPA: bi-domain-containing oxidoreductase, partial [Thermomicrobiales bacterium]